MLVLTTYSVKYFYIGPYDDSRNQARGRLLFLFLRSGNQHKEEKELIWHAQLCADTRATMKTKVCQGEIFYKLGTVKKKKKD